MARKFRKRRIFRRRRKMGRRRHHRKHNIVSTKVIRSVNGGFPDRLICTFKNAQELYFACAGGATYAAGTGGNFLYLGNTGATTGATPLNFANDVSIAGLGFYLSSSLTAPTAPYSSYRIHGSSIRIRFNQGSGATTSYSAEAYAIPMDASTYQNMGNISGGNFSSTFLQEFPYSKHASIAPYTENQGVLLRNSMSTRKMFGLKYKSLIEANEYAASYHTVPTSLWAWVIVVDPNSTSNTPIYINMEVNYTIEFFGRLIPSNFSP